MRTAMLLVMLGASSLGACKWTEFDDLSNDTWVLSIDKPDVKSSDYAVAIQRGDNGPDSATSGSLAVIGAGSVTYSELAFSQAGGASLKPNGVALGGSGGVTTLDPTPPILLASPTTADVALVTAGDASSIVVATGSHTMLIRQLFVGTTSLGTTVSIVPTPDAATYMQPPKFPGTTDVPPLEPLVASGDVVLGTVYGPLPSNAKAPACRLTVVGPVMSIRALGAVPGPTIDGVMTDDVLVWNGTDGTLHRYPSTVFNPCGTQGPSGSTSGADIPAFLPGRGSQILKIDATHVLLQGHQDASKGTASFLQVYSVVGNTIKPVGNAVTTPGLRLATLLTVGGTTYVLAGYPGATVDGKSGGEVLIFKISPTTGIDPTTPVATLHDAQPDDSQAFGRGIAAMPYNGKQVIAVAADNEIFVYFRANFADGTALYDETRQGR